VPLIGLRGRKNEWLECGAPRGESRRKGKQNVGRFRMPCF
jgi:hypothetical protein